MKESRCPRGTTLRFRLVAIIVPVVLAVVGAGMALDIRDEYRVAAESAFTSLQEHARMLEAARAYIGDDEKYCQYVQGVLADLHRPASTEYYLLVTDSTGQSVAQVNLQNHPQVETAMKSLQQDRQIMPAGNHEIACLRLAGKNGHIVVIARHFDYEDSVLLDQLRLDIVVALSTIAVLVIAIFFSMNRWVFHPIAALITAARAWSGRDFSARANPSGPSDLRALAESFNAMAEELDAFERSRQAEMDRARLIQAHQLPTSIPVVVGLRITVRHQPMQEVAGDLYDVFPLSDQRTAITVVDVSGHGISAAMLTGTVKMSLHRRLLEQPDLAEAVKLINDDLAIIAPEGHFVTAFVAVWDSSRRTWTYVGAGQIGGLLMSRTTGGPSPSLLPATGPLLGPLPDATWNAQSLSFCIGDRLFIYSDGVSDAGASSGTRLGDAGVWEILSRSEERDLDEQVDELLRQVNLRQGPVRADDVTIVAVERMAD